MTDDNRSLAEWAASEVQEPQPPTPQAAAPTAPEIEAVPETIPAAEVPAVEAEAEVSQPEVPAEEPAPVAEETKAKKPQPLPKWMRDRLAEQTAKQRESERVAAEQQARADAAEAALEAMRRKGAAPAGEAPAPVPEPKKGAPEGFVPATEVDARARQLAAEQAFNDRANASYYEGKKAYSDFDDAVGTLAAMNAVQRRDFQEAALASGAAHDVIYHLGSNPEEAQTILGYLAAGNVAKAAADMKEIAIKSAAAKAAPAPKKENKVSGAPAPIKPVGGSAVPSVDLDKASDDDFTAELNKRARENGWW